MTENKVRAVVINREKDVEKRMRMEQLMKNIHIDEYEILKAVEGGDPKFCRAMSNHMARNNQKSGYYTIVFEDDAIFTRDSHTWEQYMNNLPAENDYDIIFLSDTICTYTSTPYPKEKDYNDYYRLLPFPYFDIAGIHAYIVNPRTVQLLNANQHLTLAADDYLNYCINEYKLKTLVAREILFTQSTDTPDAYKILFYTKMWDMDDDWTGIPQKKGFVLLSDRKYLDEADVVVFHMPTLPREDEVLKRGRKKEGQLWVFWSMECEEHYKWQYDPEILALFDITMTYRIDSDIPVPYMDPIYIDWLLRSPGPKTDLVNAFISSDIDQSGRIGYLKELMSYLNVHSYGKTLNNMTLKNDEGIASKAYSIAGYKFSLAFENAIAKDYVTEKFFHPLIMGSVPVYLGAPNIDEFAPGDHCYINVRDFPSVKDLAAYLTALDKDDASYDAYLKWKTIPFRDGFIRRANTMLRHPFMRLYELIKK
jgi:glycosyl transferase family 10 (putative fucosyltransferase)